MGDEVPVPEEGVSAEGEEGVVGPDAVVHEARVLARDARRRGDVGRC